jgi:hypothetical protein
MPETAMPQDIYREHFARPPAVIEPPQAVVDSVYDADRGALRFSHVGGLHIVPDHEHLPPLVKSTVEITHEAGVWARDLSTRAAAIAQLTPADERAYQAGRLLDEIDKLTATFTDAIQAKVGDMHETVGKLRAALREPGDDLSPELARRLADHHHRLDEKGRAEFLRRAQQSGDHGALRAVATDELTPYVAPQLDRTELVDAAGRIRSPRIDAMERAYAALAARFEANIARIQEAGAKAAQAATVGVDPSKLALVRRSARR